MDVSVVIPTKNAGQLLERVLNRVFQQKTEYSYEVICVDSGSEDGTLDIIRKYPCRLFEIPALEFGHGKTRNYGAAKGTGTFIVFLTQDALPASNTWLQNLIDAMKLDDKIAGGFGIHLPYPDCNIFDKRDLKAHFDNFGQENTIYWLDDKERYETEEAYLHKLAFFSDNNACLRRTVWGKYPYPDVDFAEDQIWMRKMIELGYKKVYCPYAPVYHSHNFPLREYYGRYFDEYKGLNRIHGYLIADSWFQLPYRFLRHVLSDLRYIRSLPMKKRRKIYWLMYSVGRNYCRYYAGYKGGKYDTFSPRRQERLDKKVSQQYRQRK